MGFRLRLPKVNIPKISPKIVAQAVKSVQKQVNIKNVATVGAAYATGGASLALTGLPKFAQGWVSKITGAPAAPEEGGSLAPEAQGNVPAPVQSLPLPPAAAAAIRPAAVKIGGFSITMPMLIAAGAGTVGLGVIAYLLGRRK